MRFHQTALKHFISEPIAVIFNSPPQFIKRPPCPDRFIWRDQEYVVIDCLSQRTDFSRRGKMEKNMQPEHAKTASQKGSWGVGRYYFDVKTHDGKIYRIYYDRAPKNAVDRMGHWILLAELF